ncbi:MAG TPA: hypothetical protein PK914_07960 [Smithellaceae bacterium]|jgi:hypothetical protein|nr:hypothetical protein [Smithellaceae bacterium]HPY34997.1 hypothetical protein [Smithellaceae bacterium]
MASVDSSNVFIREFQEKYEKKLREKEVEILEYWKAQVDKIIAMRPESIASLQLQVTKMSEMMANRIKVLKKG